VLVLLLVACAKKPPPDPAMGLPDLRDEMEGHFFHALQLQLSVIGGDLPAARDAGAALERELAAATFPDAWVPFVAQAKDAAARAAAAQSIPDVAAALGDLSGACARCHVATGGGPHEAMRDPMPDAHMARHLWGAYWMGYGVMAPDERSWDAGSRALASAEIGADAPKLRHLDAKLHDLAVRGRSLTEVGARAQHWGELLVVCAECHATIERPR
jgi:cytochrome c553